MTHTPRPRVFQSAPVDDIGLDASERRLAAINELRDRLVEVTDRLEFQMAVLLSFYRATPLPRSPLGRESPKDTERIIAAARVAIEKATP